ncbi:substrate-binding periplasmic protein [Inhella gelatinilytica]|uniref:Transporter substrate-binding domain-containing protein n=1 Tax=Inhella gelatinilytica TaxID=2795030 RepID=A0A931IVT0_9BURK|nr:transporter substrate-binding domain-containing protein [Inhella gelatinilytica]MBH9553717.1 transporter substrate-binding domain-containing protein [Inhella gelatinilytica]
MKLAAGALLLALAAQAPAWACGPYRVGQVPYPGLYEPGPEGAASGLEVDWLQAVAQRSGCQLESVRSSVQGLWKSMADGDIDIATASTRTAEREALADFMVLARARPGLLMHATDGAAVASLEAFMARTEWRVGLVRGARYAPDVMVWLEALRKAGRLSESADTLALFRAFEAGRMQAVLAYPMEMAAKGAAWRQAHVLRDWFPQSGAEGGWALSRRRVSESDRLRLRQAMTALIQDGTLQRLADKHLGAEWSRSYVVSAPVSP